MDDVQMWDRKFETISWGMLFIWWGLRWWPSVSLPNGIGLVGTGLILLGLNAVRWLRSMPGNRFTTLLGILSLVCGGVLLVSEVLRVQFQLPIFEILLIVLGGTLLVRELLQNVGKE